MVYKILHDESLKQAIPIFKFSIYHSTRGHDFKLYKENCKSDKRKFTFSQRVINQWNVLPSKIVNASNINTFKMLLDSHLNYIKFEL